MIRYLDEDEREMDIKHLERAYDGDILYKRYYHGGIRGIPSRVLPFAVYFSKEVLNGQKRGVGKDNERSQ